MGTSIKLPHFSISKDVVAGLRQGLLLGTAVLVLIVPQNVYRDPALPRAPQALTAQSPMAEPVLRHADFAGEPAGADVQAVAEWVVNSRDNGQRPFVIIDKRQAHVFVFRIDGRLLGATPVLLGYAPGDDTVPGIGKRPIAQVRPEERTTPAGRFVAERGVNSGGEEIVWVDYDAAVSMHRVRANNPLERRLERLASPTVSDNRISYGCINMPVEFFERVLWPTFQAQRGIVYVLPEVKPLNQVFPGVAAQQASRLPGSSSRAPASTV